MSKEPKSIHWKEGEWRIVAVALGKRNPEYLLDPDKAINPQEMLDAMQVLPARRRRPIDVRPGGPGASQFRTGLRRVWQAIRANPADFPEWVSEPKQRETVDTVADTDTDKSKKKQAGPANDDWRHGPRILWNEAEYLAMAGYLRTRFPGQSYLESTTGAGLELEDVRLAMRHALPAERHRNLYTITPLRHHFVAAFKAAKQAAYKATEQATRSERQSAQEEFKVVAERAAERSAAATAELTALAPAAPPAAAEPAPPVPAPVPAPPVPTPQINPYEAAFAPLLRPLVALFAQELATALAPLAQQLLAGLSVPAPQAAVPEAPPEAPAAEAVPVVEPPTPQPVVQPPAPQPTMAKPVLASTVAPVPLVVVKPRRPKVGIVGLLPAQVHSVEATFPGIEFVPRYEYGNKAALASAFGSCERVLGIIKFMNHPQEAVLVKAYGKNYVRINGAASEVKRTIQMWINSGQLSPMAA